MSTVARGNTQSAVAQRWLSGYCEREGGVKSAVVLLGAGQEAAAHWPGQGAPSAPLVAAARAAAKGKRALVLTPPAGSATPGEHERIVSLPLGDEQGALAVSVGSGEERGKEAGLGEFERAAGALAAVIRGAGTGRGAGGDGRLLQLQALLLGRQGIEQASSALVSELAGMLGFERVSLGLSGRGGLEVVALSHAGEFGARQALIRALGAAMQESIDQAATIVYPLGADAPPRIVQAHRALAALASGTVILSVPLVSGGHLIGALCCERSGAVPADEARAVEQLACVLAPLIDLKVRAEQSWHARARAALRAYWSGRTGRARRIAWLAGPSALLVLALTPVGHRVGAPARLEGAVQRVVAAPAEGYLHAVHVRPGDAVEAGQLLVELAQQDLLLERRKWESELSQHENSAAAGLARAERTQYALAQARAAEARAQLELVQSRLARTQLTAPIDGLVIKGDLTQSLGAPVERGEVLLTLAPREAHRLMIEVDERDIGAVALGSRGQLALSALPGERLGFEVTRISPVALTAEGRNSFEVEAAFDTPTPGLRPGLLGVAKIEAGSAPLAWIVTHRLTDWLRLGLWTWTG